MRHALAGKKILWVEDDEFLSNVIGRKLAMEECILIRTKDAEAALAQVEEAQPDIIILDILLPDINGFELLQKLKSMPTVKHVPVILLSNLGQESDIERGAKLGAERFLVKATLTLDEIIEQVVDVLEKKSKK